MCAQYVNVILLTKQKECNFQKREVEDRDVQTVGKDQ